MITFPLLFLESLDPVWSTPSTSLYLTGGSESSSLELSERSACFGLREREPPVVGSWMSALFLPFLTGESESSPVEFFESVLYFGLRM